MASRGLQMDLVLVLVAMFWGGAMAQSDSNCNTVLTTMAPCLDFLTGNSSTPSNSCCSQVGAVVKSSPDCLCAALNGSVPSVGININRTLALSLPGACQVQTTVDQCKQAIAPAASPPGSPLPTSPSSGSSNTITPPASGSGSTSTTQDSSDGGIRRAPIHFVLFLLFVASCTSTIAKF